MGRPVGSTADRPSYRRHKASGQAVVTLAGVDHYLGKYNSAESKAEYRRLLAEWMVCGQVTSSDPGLSVVEVANAFWQHAKAFYGAGTHLGELGSYRLAVKLLKDLYGHTPAKDFGPKALTTVRQSMVSAGWCRNYCNRQTGRIKHIFKWAVSRELVDVTVYQALLAVEGLKKGKSDARESAKVTHWTQRKTRFQT